MRKIKFRSVHINNNNNFICFRHWGIDYPEKGCNTLPNKVNGTSIKIHDQFAGVLDKSGREIYENDIVKFKSSLNNFYSLMIDKQNTQKKEYITSIVKFDCGKFFFKFQYGREGIEVFWEDVKVIGNIHENTELLKNIIE